jgi:hypothetical protein
MVKKYVLTTALRKCCLLEEEGSGPGHCRPGEAEATGQTAYGAGGASTEGQDGRPGCQAGGIAGGQEEEGGGKGGEGGGRGGEEEEGGGAAEGHHSTE